MTGGGIDATSVSSPHASTPCPLLIRSASEEGVYSRKDWHTRSPSCGMSNSVPPPLE